MGNVIAFVPASGGLGASTLATAVAVRSAAVRRSCVAVDLDRYAGTLDVAFGVEESAGWRWPDLSAVDGVVDGEALASQLPMSCGVAVLAGHAPRGWGPLSHETPHGGDWLASVADVVEGLSLVHDLTVLDLSRDADAFVAVAPLVDAVVVVAGPSAGQLGAASHAVNGVRQAARAAGVRRGGRVGTSAGGVWPHEQPLPIEPWLVLRGRRMEPELTDLVMDRLDVPLVATIGDDRHVVNDLGDGRPPGARGRGDVVRAADEVLVWLARQELAA